MGKRCKGGRKVKAGKGLGLEMAKRDKGGEKGQGLRVGRKGKTRAFGGED